MPFQVTSTVVLTTTLIIIMVCLPAFCLATGGDGTAQSIASGRLSVLSDHEASLSSLCMK